MLIKSGKFNLPEIEEKVLRFWKEKGIKEKSLNKKPKGIRQIKPKSFVFYEGPPTANGKPGLHHILTRAYKDVVLRYKTMAGYFTPRRAGWDTHGLPVELQVEKELGLNSKKDIEQYGIADFNQKCRDSVWQYKTEWENLTERIGFWLDLDNPYITYENGYIEAVWTILKEARRKNLLYKGHKVVPWCPRCGTALSSHELAQGYKEVADTSVYVKFKLKPGQKIGNLEFNDSTYVLSWTTTPWTLPGNIALAVSPEAVYCQTKKNEEFFILSRLSKERADIFEKGECQTTGEFKGKELIGLEYEPLFDVKKLRAPNQSHKIYGADFVNPKDGTGAVHTAVMYGEDDYNLGLRYQLPCHHIVNEEGRFTNDVPEVAGLYVKDKETEKIIFNHLLKRDLLLKTIPYVHEYPHCWRCDTALLYYARDSWFIAVSRLKNNLLRENKKINWIPGHIKEGRMGEWLKEAKDWAVSRERYWGTPLPIWECFRCGETEIIGSKKELSERLGKAKNQYFLIRHGEARNNLEDFLCSSVSEDECPLTLAGRKQTENLGRKIKKEKIDIIFSSDMKRTRETADILNAALKIKNVFFDKRLREFDFGNLNGKPTKTFRDYYVKDAEKFEKRTPNGESLKDTAKRMREFVEDIEKKESGKKIAIISHEYPLWMLEAIMLGLTKEESLILKQRRGEIYKNGEMRKIEFFYLPRDKWGFGNLHKPYIDECRLVCRKCGNEMRRAPEVLDVWFDSGAMPWASQLPASRFQLPAQSYPADYICEGVDQTRGWFYTLLAVAVLLGKETPYKNAISLGHLLDKNGRKMSKSRGNAVDPWEMVSNYGADAVRWYFYITTPAGEPICFNEEELKRTSHQFFNLICNSYLFFETYGKDGLKFSGFKKKKKLPILDLWIKARFQETAELVSIGLDRYDVTGAARAVKDFFEDLSRWYIRRSRRRFQKPESQEDYSSACAALWSGLYKGIHLLGPFAPFLSEAIYQPLNNLLNFSHKDFKKGPMSIHLNSWPGRRAKIGRVLEEMLEVRRLAALALAKRQEAGIKLRQPLGKIILKTPNPKIKNNSELLDVLKDEINVKKVVFDDKIKNELELDTTITYELWEEGILREIVRAVQGLRQGAGLRPKDKIILEADVQGELKYIFEKHEGFLKTEVNAFKVEYDNFKFEAKTETTIEKMKAVLGLRRHS